MKKALSVLLGLTIVVSMVACGQKTEKKTEPKKTVAKTTVEQKAEKPAETTVVNSEASTTPAAEAEKKTVTVTTSFLQDMVKQIAGDTVEVELIIPAGEDPHLYVAKPSDLTKLKNADMILYHGLHFEGKMNDILHQANGIEVSKDFPEDKIGKMEEDGKEIIDPHFWFDISLYKQATMAAAQALEQLNPSLKDVYQKRAEEYLKELDELDAYNKEQLSRIPSESRYLITPHDAFNYFSRYYDIAVQAPQGVSTDSEVAAKDLEETADFIVKHKIKAIFVESTTDPARMEALQAAVKQKGWDVKIVRGEGQELFSDSLAPAGHDGDTYIDMYKHNTDLMAKNLK